MGFTPFLAISLNQSWPRGSKLDSDDAVFWVPWLGPGQGSWEWELAGPLPLLGRPLADWVAELTLLPLRSFHCVKSPLVPLWWLLGIYRHWCAQIPGQCSGQSHLGVGQEELCHLGVRSFCCTTRYRVSHSVSSLKAGLKPFFHWLMPPWTH